MHAIIKIMARANRKYVNCPKRCMGGHIRVALNTTAGEIAPAGLANVRKKVIIRPRCIIGEATTEADVAETATAL